ncbi:MAG TPA: hypothetical protein VEI57_15960 [Nitrospirota bacterium]|nr:hypothetical protein [Nitrospirota bacterium]
MADNARETVVDYTTYEYDEKGRIKYMKMYPSGKQVEALMRSEFVNAAGSIDPDKMEVTSVIEKK